MKAQIKNSFQCIALIIIITMLALSSCSQRSMQGAGQGAASGAVVGAVGGMVSALVFGGDVAEAGARGAVYGGATGAAAGAMSGAMAESNQKKAQQAAELEALRKKLGNDVFQGLEALVECKHEVAEAYSSTALKSANSDFALAGLWLQIITYADKQQEDKAKALFPELVAKDSKISSLAQAEAKKEEVSQKLRNIRQENNLPKSCK